MEALQKIAECTFYYDRYGEITKTEDDGYQWLAWNCDLWGCPWDLDFTSASPQPGTIETWAEHLFGKHFVRHIVTVELPPKKIDQIIPHLKLLPDLQTVLVTQDLDGRNDKREAAEVDAVIEQIKTEIPNIAVDNLSV